MAKSVPVPFTTEIAPFNIIKINDEDQQHVVTAAMATQYREGFFTAPTIEEVRAAIREAVEAKKSVRLGFLNWDKDNYATIYHTAAMSDGAVSIIRKHDDPEEEQIRKIEVVGNLMDEFPVAAYSLLKGEGPTLAPRQSFKLQDLDGERDLIAERWEAHVSPEGELYARFNFPNLDYEGELTSEKRTRDAAIHPETGVLSGPKRDVTYGVLAVPAAQPA